MVIHDGIFCSLAWVVTTAKDWEILVGAWANSFRRGCTDHLLPHHPPGTKADPTFFPFRIQCARGSFLLGLRGALFLALEVGTHQTAGRIQSEVSKRPAIEVCRISAFRPAFQVLILCSVAQPHIFYMVRQNNRACWAKDKPTYLGSLGECLMGASRSDLTVACLLVYATLLGRHSVF